MPNKYKTMLAVLMVATVVVLLPPTSAEAHEAHAWFPCLKECCRQKHAYYSSSYSSGTVRKTTKDSGAQDNQSAKPGERDTAEKESEEAGSRGGTDAAAGGAAAGVASTAETNRRLAAIEKDIREMRALFATQAAERAERLRRVELSEMVALEVSRRFAAAPLGETPLTPALDQNHPLVKTIEQLMNTQAQTNKANMERAMGDLEKRMKTFMHTNFQPKSANGGAAAAGEGDSTTEEGSAAAEENRAPATEEGATTAPAGGTAPALEDPREPG